MYTLRMLCVSGDWVTVFIHRYEDIFKWLKTLDHEGSSWTVTVGRKDKTDQIVQEYPAHAKD